MPTENENTTPRPAMGDGGTEKRTLHFSDHRYVDTKMRRLEARSEGHIRAPVQPRSPIRGLGSGGLMQPKTVKESGVFGSRLSELLASVARPQTPAQISPLSLPQKSTPSLFVTPGAGLPTPSSLFQTPASRTPSTDPLYSLFNTPAEEQLSVHIASAQTPVPHPTSVHISTNISERIKTHARKKSTTHESSEESAKKAAEVLKQRYAPLRQRKGQLDMSASLALAQAFNQKQKNVSPKKGKKRKACESGLVFGRSPSPEPEPIPEDDPVMSRGSSVVSTVGMTPDATPQKRLRQAGVSEESNDTHITGECATPSPRKEKEKGGKPRPTQFQKMLKKTREEEGIRQRDVQQISREFREGRSARLGW